MDSQTDLLEVKFDAATPVSKDEESAPHAEQLALPPADGGKDAWLVLFSAFVLEAMTWGFPFSSGVYQEYYASHEPFSQDVSSLAVIGTTATGLMYLLAPVVYFALRKFPRYRKACSIFGFVLLQAALIGASFANTTPQLLMTQGVLYGVSAAIEYYPVFLYLDEWWIARRGLAYGLLFCGAGTSGFVCPLLMQWLLAAYGFRTAFRCWAVISLVLTIPALTFMKGRLPSQHAATGPQYVEWGFLKSSAFWVMQVGNMIQGLGYFMPALYLPSFAQAVGLSAVAGTVAVSLVNAACVAGGPLVGLLIDRYHVTTCVNICAIGTMVAVFLFWSFAVNAPMLFMFSILYGLFAGGFVATWSGVAFPIQKKYPAVETGMIVAFLSAGKGVGSVISGPLSGFLIASDTWKHHIRFAFGSGYGYLIMFSGLTASLSMVGWCGKKVGLV